MENIKKYIIGLLTFFTSVLYAQVWPAPDDTIQLRKILNTFINNSTAIFEGQVNGVTGSILDDRGNVWTLYDVNVNYLNWGNVGAGHIVMAKRGGVLGDLEQYVMDAELLSDVNTFVTNTTFKVTDVNTTQQYYIIKNVPYDNNYNVIGGGTDRIPINHHNELMTLLSTQLTGFSFPMHKPARAGNGHTNDQTDFNTIHYSESSKNFHDLIKLKSESRAQNRSALTSAIEDVELQLMNPAITGVGTNYYEFDVYIKGSSSSTYLDNIPVHLDYNNSSFGTNIVAAGNVLVTNGSGFPLTTYFNGNSFKTDLTISTFAFAIPYNSGGRTNITTSFVKLCHVKIKLINCGVSTSVFLTNNSTAINSANYALGSTSASLFGYDNLIYSGSTLSTYYGCGPTITNFNTGVICGVDTVTIRGYNFGTTKGDVSFLDADQGGNIYNTLDTNDYVGPWTDSLIKVRIPSFIRHLYTPGGVNHTCGGGPFKVTTAGAQVATSGNNANGMPFDVDFAVFASDKSNAPGGPKARLNLLGDGAGQNYTLYCDTSIGRYPLKFRIAKKALREWACFTTFNVDLIYDSTKVDGPNVNMLYMIPFGASPAFANTPYSSGVCPQTGHRGLLNFDVIIRSDEAWRYDTVMTNNIPQNMADFYEIITHEFGHAMGLQHNRKSNWLMYYAGNFNTSGPILAANRKHLVITTPDIYGGQYQMFKSVATINASDLSNCGFTDIQPNNNNCSQVGISEYGSNQLNAKIYPNPAPRGQFTLEYENPVNEKSVIEIRDLIGRSVYYEETSTYDTHVEKNMNVENLKTGLYILTIKSGNAVSTFKLIKE